MDCIDAYWGGGYSGATTQLSTLPRARLSTLAAKVRKQLQDEYQAGILAKKSTAVNILVSLISGEVEEESYLTAAELSMSFRGNSWAYTSHWESVLRK